MVVVRCIRAGRFDWFFQMFFNLSLCPVKDVTVIFSYYCDCNVGCFIYEVLCYIIDINKVFITFVGDHEDIEIFYIFEQSFIPVIINTTGRSVHVHMAMPLKAQVIEGVIRQLHQPRAVVISRCYGSCRNLLRIDQDIFNKIMLCIYLLNYAVCCYLSRALSGKSLHLKVCIRCECNRTLRMVCIFCTEQISNTERKVQGCRSVDVSYLGVELFKQGSLKFLIKGCEFNRLHLLVSFP